jgi:hypothetical protein
MKGVIIGVDPRKMSVTIEVVDHRELLLGWVGSLPTRQVTPRWCVT